MINMEVIGLCQQVGNRQLLDKISFTIEAGTLVGIAGGNGAGKSTLLRAISGVNAPSSGKVLYNLKPYCFSAHEWDQVIGLVPQYKGAVLHDNLTAYSALQYRAQLTLEANLTAEDVDQRIDQLLGELGLTKERDKPVSGLSTGESTRLCLASEMLAEPAILFLDEPGEGLDELSRNKIIDTLIKCKHCGITIVIIAHCLEFLNACDQVIYLAKEQSGVGFLAYDGPPENLFPYFRQKFQDPSISGLDDLHAKLLGRKRPTVAT